MLLGAIGLDGCDKDDDFSKDDFSKDVYQGCVQKALPGAFTIKITYSPYDNEDMPFTNELISCTTPDSPDLELKVDQKLSFRIESAESLPMLHLYGPDTCPSWKCKIKILKLH